MHFRILFLIFLTFELALTHENESLNAYFWSVEPQEEIELEEDCQTFILETKRILLKEYEHAFNPGIVRFKDLLILSFRIIPNPLLTFNSQIGFVLLDDDFNPKSKPQILDTQDSLSLVPSRAEDGRLIVIGEKLYLVYSDNKEDYISKGGFRVYISEIDYRNNKFVVVHTDCLKEFEGANPYLREKNWVPFDYHGNMMLAYSLIPHTIFQHLPKTNKCETIAITQSKLTWGFGELRGGTPAVLDGDQYISFFHSSMDLLSVYSNKRCIAHYFMGAYTFSSTPPFKINKISPRPIIGKGFYKGVYYKYYWKSVMCVFPCGILVEEPFIYVSYGRQDHEMWIVKIDKQELLDSLVDCQD